MKKRIAIFVVLAMVLCLALTGCGQSDKKGEDVGAAEIIVDEKIGLDETYWVANYYGSTQDGDKLKPVDADNDGIVLVFRTNKVSFIDSDGIYLENITYELTDDRIKFDVGEAVGPYAILDGDELTLYSLNGAIWWVMSKADIDTANAYLEKLLKDADESFVIPDNFDTGDWVIMDGSNNSGGDTGGYKDATNGNDESIPDAGAWEETHVGGSAGSIDNMNPKQDADGMYVYEVRGHKVRLKTNIWDYIGNQRRDNLFLNNYISEDLGYPDEYNYDGLYMHKNSDGSLIYVGFQHHDDNTCEVVVGTNNGSVATVKYGFFDASKMGYVTDALPYPVSLEFIILCTYALEYNVEHPGQNPFEEILSDYASSDFGSLYILPSPE